MATNNKQAFETIHVRLPVDLVARVRAEAQRRETEVEAYIQATLAAGLTHSSDVGEMQERQAEAFAASGTTEEQLSEFCDDFVHRFVRGGERLPDGSVKYK